MKDFLLFRRLITPVLIQVVFWLCFAFLVYAGIKDIMLKAYFTAVQVLIAGPLLLRVVCELLILAFRINTNLYEINQKLSSPQQS